jgi:3-hydroxypropanoate dehydrogenase
MNSVLDETGRDLLFRAARSHKAWLDKPVLDSTLRELYDLLKWGPTSANTCPMRVLFLRSVASKERLRPALAAGNVQKTMTAPVTAVIAYDRNFASKLPQLFPHDPRAGEAFVTSKARETTATRNGTLQAGYLILAARAVGLHCGPMTGFNADMVDREFFGAQQSLFPGGDLRSDILCNLGYGDPSRLFPRDPRLGFDQACVLL